jgi:hypothetical protein
MNAMPESTLPASEPFEEPRAIAACPVTPAPRRHPHLTTGRNGDQLYRLFNIPADVFVVQHCHNIGAAVRKQALAFALQRSLTASCQVLFVDGMTTARLLRAQGEWPSQPTDQRRRTRP